MTQTPQVSTSQGYESPFCLEVLSRNSREWIGYSHLRSETDGHIFTREVKQFSRSLSPWCLLLSPLPLPISEWRKQIRMPQILPAKPLHTWLLLFKISVSSPPPQIIIKAWTIFVFLLYFLFCATICSQDFIRHVKKARCAITAAQGCWALRASCILENYHLMASPELQQCPMKIGVCDSWEMSVTSNMR